MRFISTILAVALIVPSQAQDTTQDSIVFPVRNEKGQVVFSVSSQGSISGSSVHSKSTKTDVLTAGQVQIGETNVAETLTSLSTSFQTLSQSLVSSSEKSAKDLSEASTAFSKKIDGVKIEILERLVQENEARVIAKAEADKTIAAKDEANKAALESLQQKLAASEEKLATVRTELEGKITKQTDRINALISIITKFDVSSELEKLSTAPAEARAPQKKKK
jgi:hypothetical protein